MTNKFIENLLTAAFEGGSNYWIEGVEVIHDRAGTQYMSQVISNGGTLRIIDDELNAHTLTRPAIVKGINYALSGQQIKDEDYDAGDADTALQYALFGEVVYG
jgi:hypothetical protein